MKIYLGFLLSDRLVHHSYWSRWIELLRQYTEVEIGAHCHTGVARDEFTKLHKTETAWTRWEQTIQAHAVLLKDAHQKGADRFLLFSQSCIPILHPAVVYTHLLQDVSWFNYLDDITGTHWYRMYYEKRNGKYQRSCDNWIHAGKHIKFCEQWYIVNRTHMEVLLDDIRQGDRKQGFYFGHRNCFADNESWAISTLLYEPNGVDRQTIINHPTTFVEWIIGRPHPNTHHKIDAELLNKIAKSGSWFARKFNERVTRSTPLSYLP